MNKQRTRDAWSPFAVLPRTSVYRPLAEFDTVNLLPPKSKRRVFKRLVKSKKKQGHDKLANSVRALFKRHGIAVDVAVVNCDCH